MINDLNVLLFSFNILINIFKKIKCLDAQQQVVVVIDHFDRERWREEMRRREESASVHEGERRCKRLS